VDARAFERAFAPPADPTGAHEVLGLADVERLLRLDGGDLSVSIEPQRRAVLTAWVPVAPHKLRNAPPVTERASDGPAGADQPSR
jgi:hypothetical protein